MSIPDYPTELAPSPAPLTIDQVVAVVDELAIASAPTPRSRILRPALITQLRDAVTPSIGSTGPGRGGGRGILVDVGAFTLWEDITGRIEALHEDLEGEAPSKGSHEQILLAWSRDLVAADTAMPNGMNQDAIAFALSRVTRIRDLISHHFDPPRTGDVPGAACLACDAITATTIHDGEHIEAPTIAWTFSPRTGLNVLCRTCDTTWSGTDLALLDRFRWTQRRAERIHDLTTPLTADDWHHLRLDLREAARPKRSESSES